MLRLSTKGSELTSPTIPKLVTFVFAAGAVVAFALIAAVASGFFREELEDQPSNVKSVAGALSFFSVGLALGVAYVVGILIQGWQRGQLAPS